MKWPTLAVCFGPPPGQNELLVWTERELRTGAGVGLESQGGALPEQALEAESQAKHTRNVRLKTQWAHFPYNKGLDQFNFDFQPSVDERKLRELAGLAFLERKENVLLLGPPGVGKTHLAIALGTEAIVAGNTVYFVTVQDLVQQFQRARDENKLKERMTLLVKPKLLILD